MTRSLRVVASLVIVSAIGSAGCLYARVFYLNTPTLAAATHFESRPVRASSRPIALERAVAEASFETALDERERARWRTFDGLLEANKTRAFVVLRDERIVYERYFDGVRASTLLPAFSISKTIAALLVGCAIDDGLIHSVDDPLTTYVPELATRAGYRDIRLEHLLRMTSGIDFDEESIAGALLYYTTDLPSWIYAYDMRWSPGTHYLYGSISTQILWDVLHRRLGGKTVSQYFEERVWERLGATSAAAWSLDGAESGTEKLFGGFSATARDHARLGLLFLNAGEAHGRTVVSHAWVDASLSPDPIAGEVHTTDGAVLRGKYQWFLAADGHAFFAKGYHGQYIFVVPSRNVVFVRFGEGYGDVDWTGLFSRLANGL